MNIPPEAWHLIGVLVESLAPLVIDAVAKGEDPVTALLKEHVADTLPLPLKSQIALAAILARDAAKAGP